MRLAALVLLAASLCLAAGGPRFDVTDARGKKPAGVTVEASEPDRDGWFQLKVVKAKGEPVVIWPFDGMAKLPDGPEPIPVIVIQRGDEMMLTNPRVIAALATPVALGLSAAGPDLTKAIPKLAESTDPFERGVGLLLLKKPAADQLAGALKERRRQLTRMPSEIYAAALLYGQALMTEKKFDDAAVAFLTALKQRPSAGWVQKIRAQALTEAGKPDAAAQ